MIDITPGPIAIQLGPLPIYWYGIAYAVGLAVAYVVLIRQATRFGQDPELIGNGLIVIAVAALIGGRLYHVIDQFNACGPGGPCYSQNLLKIILPPYSGLGVYGGLITGVIAFLLLVRHHRVNPWVWADIVAPALFTMQAIGRWGNFFNQELYGPPTNLPWGIAIDCAHRVAAYPCSAYPEATTGFQPLFLYESLSGLLGLAILLWISSKRPYPLRPGDQILIFFIWYPVVRFGLEYLRTGNWQIDGIPTAQIMSVGFALGALLLLIYRHRGPVAEPMPEGPDPRLARSDDDDWDDDDWDDDDEWDDQDDAADPADPSSPSAGPAP